MGKIINKKKYEEVTRKIFDIDKDENMSNWEADFVPGNLQNTC